MVRTDNEFCRMCPSVPNGPQEIDSQGFSFRVSCTLDFGKFDGDRPSAIDEQISNHPHQLYFASGNCHRSAGSYEIVRVSVPQVDLI